MRRLHPTQVLGAVLACVALPVQAAGLTNGRITDTRDDVVRAASDAQDVANMAAYEDRIVVLPPTPAVQIPVQSFAAPTVAPEGFDLAVSQGPDARLIGLFVFGGLAAIPALFGGGGAGGGFAAPPTLTPGNPTNPTNPSGPEEQPGTDVPSPVPEPATWAMLLLGFAAVGASVRRGRATGERAAA